MTSMNKITSCLEKELIYIYSLPYLRTEKVTLLVANSRFAACHITKTSGYETIMLKLFLGDVGSTLSKMDMNIAKP